MESKQLGNTDSCLDVHTVASDFVHAEGGRGGAARLAGGGVRGSPRREVGEGPPGRKTEEARGGLASVKRRTKGSGGAGHGRSSTMGKKGTPSRQTWGRGRRAVGHGEEGACVTRSPASSPIPPNTEGHGSVLSARGRSVANTASALMVNSNSKV